jgi:hypothetical protein
MSTDELVKLFNARARRRYFFCQHLHLSFHVYILSTYLLCL